VPVISTIKGIINRRVVVQAGLGTSMRPYLKISKAKRAGGMPQAVECLLSKCKALSSNISTVKKKKVRPFIYLGSGLS
jgi:hypothetical protein